MRQFLFALISIGLVSTCFHKKETNDDVVLSLPFGRYYNWTNYELKQMNFKLGHNELLIDTTYDLKLTEFKAHHSETLQNCPEITKFLRKSVPDLRSLQDTLSDSKCDNLKTFYVQYSNGSRIEQIEFNGAEKCDTFFTSIYQEMKKLQLKYKP